MRSRSSQPGTQDAMKRASNRYCSSACGGAGTVNWLSISIRAPSALHALDDHGGVDDAAVLDDHVAVQRDGALAHGHVVVAARGALAAALGVGPGGEQEVAGEAARGGPGALGGIAVQGQRVPAALRVEAP